MALEIGMTAPELQLQDHQGHSVALSQFRGKNVLIAFFPLAWTPV